MQVQLTQEAKIASVFLYIRAIFAFVGFVSALNHRPHSDAVRAMPFARSAPVQAAAGAAETVRISFLCT